MAKKVKTALIVDDEEALREIIVEVLAMMDIKALPAENGMRAVEITREQKNEIDLMLIDMFMPKMSGDETYTKLCEIVPDCPVIFMSGYDEEQEDRDKNDTMLFLKKPFTINDLKAAISEFI